MENQFFVDGSSTFPQRRLSKSTVWKQILPRGKATWNICPVWSRSNPDVCQKVMTSDARLRCTPVIRQGTSGLPWNMKPAPSRISRPCSLRRRSPSLNKWHSGPGWKPGKHFGNTVYLFTPLYIANYCENYCVYCGFNCYNHINRMKLNMEQIEHEMKIIADSGMEEILILTGESRAQSDVKYIGEACKLARKYFRMVGLEIYPVNTDEYRYLHECGADYVTVFQETYDTDKYETLHLLGHKRVWPYRFDAQERALRGGMRGVAFLCAAWAFPISARMRWQVRFMSTIYSANILMRRCPCPARDCAPSSIMIRSIPWMSAKSQLCQVLCAYRIFLPFVGITVSSRESAASSATAS